MRNKKDDHLIYLKYVAKHTPRPSFVVVLPHLNKKVLSRVLIEVLRKNKDKHIE